MLAPHKVYLPFCTIKHLWVDWLYSFSIFVAGKLSQPSPVQTRSARKKKAELNATLGTPNSKAVSPTKTVKGKNLNSKTTPKTQKSTPKAKGMKNSNKEDFKLELDDEMDSDDLDSDDNMVADHDSDDIDSDDEFIGINNM